MKSTTKSEMLELRKQQLIEDALEVSGMQVINEYESIELNGTAKELIQYILQELHNEEYAKEDVYRQLKRLDCLGLTLLSFKYLLLGINDEDSALIDRYVSEKPAGAVYWRYLNDSYPDTSITLK